MHVMGDFNWLLLGIQMALLLVILYIIIRLLPTFQKREKEMRGTEAIIRSLLDDIRIRIEGRDRKIAELMVRVEVLEDRYKKLVEGEIEQLAIKIPEKMKVEEVESKVSEEIRRVGKPQDVVLIILRALDERPYTSNEIQRMIGRSREHTARLLKSLYEKGLVVRQEEKKPFIYRISEMGREVLRSTG